MDKIYQPNQIESKWYQHWENNDYFSPKAAHDTYCIMLPPPNITGSLHIGHAFQDSLMDALIRYHRMNGKQTLWQPGTDHAGIATQMVVERQLNAQGINKYDLGREKFVEKIWDWKTHSGDTIVSQMRRLGASADWSRSRFTMDEGLSNAVQSVFISLYNEGLIYRGKKLVNWDPVLHTAVSDLEVISEEEEGSMWYIKYPLKDQSSTITIATTRPETLLGDVAVAVHPDDKRYQSLIGKELILPLCHRNIPIIADETVDPDFGTGCVKITPAHDFNDYEMGLKHQLNSISILDKSAKLNHNVPEQYQGLDRFVARSLIVEQLLDQGYLEKIEPHKLKVPRGDRSGAIIEPLLTDQWFVNAKKLAPEAINVVKTGKIKFVPENWSNTYYDWMENIQDWCISRQLWWGHRIPAWYDQNGQVYVGKNEDDVRKHYHLNDSISLVQDQDVLDTWFSSALWPFSTLGWPEKTNEFNQFYPTQVLVTGFDIIFFWVARMIMMGLKFTNQIPFSTVFVTGLIQDADGQKMSKSKGNVIDPIDLIEGISLDNLLTKRTSNLMQPQLLNKIKQATEKRFPEGIPAFGTDALRMTLCAMASPGRHVRFDIKRIEGHRNFCNKLWNASRFVLMQTEDNPISNSKKFSLADKWIKTQLQEVIESCHKYFESYRFDLLAHSLYEFTWNHYCDWYLEFAKAILTDNDTSEEEKATTRYTLLSVLENILRLLHPLIPFLTEEIWQRLPNEVKQSNPPSIMLQSYPQKNIDDLFIEAHKEMTIVMQIITQIRTIRSEMNVNPGKKLSVYFNASTSKHALITKAQRFLISLGKIESITFLSINEKPPIAATGIVEDLEVYIPMANLIDKEAELSRTKKEINKSVLELNKIETKLNNVKFIDNAPPDVVTIERERFSHLKITIEKLTLHLSKIEDL